jgi:ribonuclease BN (tRNA processing enzyme)
MRAWHDIPMPPVRLRFVGSGDAFAAGGRFHTCFHLDGDREPVLIDCGATSIAALKSAGIDPASIGWVALSHLHGDHFAGLAWLILDGTYAGRSRPLVIAGPVTTEERFRAMFEAIYPGATSSERPFEISFLEYSEGEPTALGPAIVTPFEVIHPSGAPPYALRIEYGGRTLAYSGDTEWTPSLLEAARDTDLFVCECNFFEHSRPGHLDYRTVHEHRERFGTRRLVLTHMSQDMLDHLDEVEIETAHDGLELEF